TSGSGAGARWQSRGCATKWSRRSGTSSTSATSRWSTHRFSRARSVSTRARCSPPTTSISGKPIWPRPVNSTSRPRPRRSSRSTAAVSKLQALGADIMWGQDLGGEAETLLAKQYDRPVMVFNYPKAVKAFYMKENPADPRTVLNNDMLAPEGYGEIIGGSQREDDYDRLLARIREEQLPEEAYGWYLDLRKYGTFVHSGFGLGVERTVAWICGIPHIREAIAFPRTLYKLWP